MNEECNKPPEEQPTTAASPPEENWKEKYLMALAETENMRKRMQKERYETSKFAIESTIVEFLSPMDNFENALRFAGSASPEVKNWAIGFEMILSQFKEVLGNHGIHPFSSEGTQFNPLQHEAVEISETTESLDGTILQDFSKGYKSSARVIRPARVKVAKNPQNTQTKQEEEGTTL